jgi:hypothetical protein
MALYRLFYKEVRKVFSAWSATPMISACCLDVWRMVCGSLRPERARSFVLPQVQGLFQQILLYREPPYELFDFFAVLAANGPELIDYLFDSGFVEQMLRRYDGFSYAVRKLCSEILVAIFENGSDRQLGRFFGVGVNFFILFVDLCDADDVEYQDTILGGLHTIFTRMRLSNRLSFVKKMFIEANGINVFGSMDEGAEKALALLREFELDAPPEDEDAAESDGKEKGEGEGKEKETGRGTRRKKKRGRGRRRRRRRRREGDGKGDQKEEEEGEGKEEAKAKAKGTRGVWAAAGRRGAAPAVARARER